jgi:transcription elongation factor Elf1
MTEPNLDEIRFCPSCGHEGHDLICPVCHQRTESLEDEVNRIAKIENDKKDIFEDVSLEAEQDGEDKKESQNDQTQNL